MSQANTPKSPSLIITFKISPEELQQLQWAEEARMVSRSKFLRRGLALALAEIGAAPTAAPAAQLNPNLTPAS